MTLCFIVGGLSLRSIRSAWEKLSAGSSWSKDAPCCPSPEIHLTEASAAVHWVSPWRTAAAEEDAGDLESETSRLESQPRSLQDDPAAGEEDWDSWSDSEVDIYVGEEEFIQERWLKAERDYEGDWEEDGESEEEDLDEEWDSTVSTQYQHALRGLFPLLQKATQVKSWGSESELQLLREGESFVAVGFIIVCVGVPYLTYYRKTLKGVSKLSYAFQPGPLLTYVGVAVTSQGFGNHPAASGSLVHLVLGV